MAQRIVARLSAPAMPAAPMVAGDGRHVVPGRRSRGARDPDEAGVADDPTGRVVEGDDEPVVRDPRPVDLARAELGRGRRSTSASRRRGCPRRPRPRPRRPRRRGPGRSARVVRTMPRGTSAARRLDAGELEADRLAPLVLREPATRQERDPLGSGVARRDVEDDACRARGRGPRSSSGARSRCPGDARLSTTVTVAQNASNSGGCT